MEEVIKIAEEEIKRTSQEAVKEALVEAGSQIAYEKERARLFEEKSRKLEIYSRELQKEAEELRERNRKRIIAGALIGGAGGILITSAVFAICSLLAK